MKRIDPVRRPQGSRFVAIIVALFVGGGLVPSAFAQVPGTTGPGVIEDLTGSGRPVDAESGGAGQGASEDSARQAPASETAPPQERAAPEQGVSAGDASGERAGETKSPASGAEDATPAENVTTSEPPADSSDTANTEPDTKAAPRAGVAAVESAAPAKPTFVVGSWAGAYGKAQREAVIEPVERELDVVIERRTPGAGAAGLEGMDVVELAQEKLLLACRDGRLLPISDWPDEVGGGGVSGNGGVDRDFLVATGPNDCGLASFAWSSILVANPSAMKALAKRRYREPGSIRSLVDVRRYPGKRALIREPRRVLEMMLLADGVERGDVYRVLSSRAGEDRAFELLDALQDDVEWVSGPRAAFAALDEGRVTMAMTFSGRAFRRLIASELRPIWDGHVIDYASWAVPKATSKGAEAVKFIRAALKPERMAAQARIWPYGPMRRSAVVLARRHALLGTELDVFLPTSELRFEQGIVFNALFWAENGERLEKRFDDWLNGVPLGIRVPPPRKAPPAPLPPPPRLRTGG